jgi:uncharacterized protein YqhQ
MKNKELKMPSYGGQALIEGVLMRGQKFLAAAFRQPDGSIKIINEELSGLYKSKISKLPFLRGLIVLWDALGLGLKYITLSANIQTGDDEKIEGPAMIFTVVISFALAIGLFFLLPTGIAALFQKVAYINPFTTNLLEGVIRLIIIILYIWLVGKSKDIRKVFTYHGAEHKTINAYEAGANLSPEEVSKFPLYHPRCGTGFILILVIFSIILFTLLGPISNILLRLSSRVLLIPILVMVAYEYMRFSSNYVSHPILKYLSSPGMILQRLTTNEPSYDILEVSIAAFKSMYELENG